MANLSPSAGLEDLVWIERRFRNILDLVPKLQEAGGLEAYLSELKSSVEASKAEFAKAQQDLLLAKKTLSEAKTFADDVVSTAQIDAKTLLEETKKDIEAQKAAAKDEISKEITNLAAQKQKKVQEVSDLQKKSDDLSVEIQAQTASLESLNAAIAELKAKF